MDFAGISVRPDEIVTILRLLKNYLNRDKNAICLGLIIVNENIIQWYREIASIIDHEIAKNLLQPGEKMTVEDARRLLTYIDQNRRQDVITGSLSFLIDIINKYNNNELRSLVDKLDINRIRKIQYVISGRKEGDSENLIYRSSFIPKVNSEMGLFTFVEMMKKYGDLSRAEKLRRWLKDLEAIKNEIRDNISLVLHELDCQQQSIEALRQQVLNESKSQE